MTFGFFGIMSSGKGVLSTVFLKYLLNQNPKRVIANCYLNQDNMTRLTTEELYTKSKTPIFFKNSYLYITELHNIIDARRSSSLLNTNFTQFLSQIGKLSCTVIYDSQLYESQIDTRMREFTPIRFTCQRFKIIDNKPIPAIFDDRIIKDEKGNLVPIAIHVIMESTFFPLPKDLGFYIPTQQDYDYYKTREIITLDREKFKSR